MSALEPQFLSPIMELNHSWLFSLGEQRNVCVCVCVHVHVHACACCMVRETPPCCAHSTSEATEQKTWWSRVLSPNWHQETRAQKARDVPKLPLSSLIIDDFSEGGLGPPALEQPAQAKPILRPAVSGSRGWVRGGRGRESELFTDSPSSARCHTLQGDCLTPGTPVFAWAEFFLA